LATVQLCPPMPAKGVEPFDAHAFAGRKSQPVEATYHGAAGWTSTGIDFPSYGSMSTRTHKQRGRRRLQTPPWALTSDLRLVITEYLVQRAFPGKHTSAAVRTLPLLDQVQLADAELRKRAPALETRIDKLCSEFVELKNAGGDPARLAVLERQIENLDSSIIISQHALQTVGAVAYLFWRTDVDSPSCAEATGVHSPAVRQLIFRLCRAAERLGFSAPIRNPRRGVRKP
jgi:hypothetical protein